VLCGHIHRAQVLNRDLAARPLAAPVLYPGSIERTSAAERFEEKGYLRIEISRGSPLRWRFVELPTQPMEASAARTSLPSRRRLGW
jgi:DNA repair exonuclease SbcCD nuclease subunit